MHSLSSLRNKLLVASPNLKDKYFGQSVVYIYDHSDEKGTIGFLLNKPSEKNLKEALCQIGIISHTFSCPPTQPVFTGGPCFENEMFLMTPQAKKDRFELSLMTPKEAQFKFASDGLPSEDLIFLSGYSAWQPRQLEEEIRNNTWLLVSDFDQTAFNINHENSWLAQISSYGICPSKIFDVVGNA